MKIKLLTIIFSTLFIASICAAAPAMVPEKYNLDNKLEKVDSIYKYKLMSWNRIDNQSFELQTGPSEYYLIVLSFPSDKLPFTEHIKITDTNGMVRPGYNNVIVRGSGFKDNLVINKIYKFKDANQVKEIEAELTAVKK